MLRKKFAVLVLFAAATVASSAVPASADGPKNEKEAAVCSQLLGSVVPGLVPTQTVCTVNGGSGNSGTSGSTGHSGAGAVGGELEDLPTWDV